MTISPLTPLAKVRNYPGPLVLVILDGIGLGARDESDGVFVSHTPVLDALLQEPFMMRLKAHGRAVGLPSDEDMGNSEVGHNALGAGRIFNQGAKLVNEAIATGSVFQGEAWQRVTQAGLSGKTVHFIGLVSDGNVHSHVDQLYALLEACVQAGVRRVRVHALLDGRDVDQKSALRYIEPLEARLANMSADGRDYGIASGGGRMVTTMDRYNANWQVVEKGWKAHVLGVGRQFASASEAIRTYYQEDSRITDQYMDSFVIAADGNPVGAIEDGDAVIFFNFRGDRAIEISRAFEEADFVEFERVRFPKVFYAGMMQYDGDALVPKNYLVQPPAIGRTLGEYLCRTGISSFAISETQKFGHVTYFWNGNRSGYIDRGLESYEEILSDKIAFDLRPWMKAAEITDRVLEVVAGGRHRFIRLNFANGDMVGHTGVEPAIRIAVATVDMCLGRILEAVSRARGIAVVTADHGNADCMWTKKNGAVLPMVAHTLNPVPFIIKDFSGVNAFRTTDVTEPGLANVAATLCTLLGHAPPKDYEPSLVSLT
jgi:2,3-bisphosphoglycerate-independent phosphoglycerate mutase